MTIVNIFNQIFVILMKHELFEQSVIHVLKSAGIKQNSYVAALNTNKQSLQLNNSFTVKGSLIIVVILNHGDMHQSDVMTASMLSCRKCMETLLSFCLL